MSAKVVWAGIAALGLVALAYTGSEPVPIPTPTAPTSPKFEIQPPKPTTKSSQTQAAVYKPAVAQNCDPNYSGCLNSSASDYDCAGGSGNGPYYTGTVRVLGYDKWGSDRDHDGWGCE